MKTYEEFKKMVLANEYSIMKGAKKRLDEDKYNHASNKTADEMLIKECATFIDNIDEVVAFEIGHQTNQLIRGFQTAYKYHTNEYFKNFSEFVDNYVRGITPDGKEKNGTFFCQSQCFDLGVGIQELSCFKDNDPLKEETGDVFRTIVNANFGTNIPMAAEVKKAEESYRTNPCKETLMHLMQVKRNSGNNGEQVMDVKQLSTNQEYQEIKTGFSR